MPVDTSQGGSQNEVQQLMASIQQVYQRAAGQANPAGSQPNFTPGQVNPLTPTITFNPQGAPGQPMSYVKPSPYPSNSPTGSQSIGGFGNKREAVNAGLVSLGNSLSSLFGAAEQKEHQKKATMAENYMMQINSLLASGDPQDRQKAMTILEDPKIRKILKTGLDYVPLEEPEPPPPEAVGVATAVNKIKTNMQNQPPQQPKMQPVLPQPSAQDKLKAAVTNALLQKIQQDPASALTMMGGSQLSSAEQRASEFYKAGLGLSPAQADALTLREKLAGMRTYETIMKDLLKMQVDLYKAGLAKDIAKGHDQAKITAQGMADVTRKYVADQIKAAATYKADKSGSVKKYDTNATGAKVYASIAKEYGEMATRGKTRDGRPLSDEQKQYYLNKQKEYEQKATDLLDQSEGEDLINDFMNAVEGEGDADTSDDTND